MTNVQINVERSYGHDNVIALQKSKSSTYGDLIDCKINVSFLMTMSFIDRKVNRELMAMLLSGTDNVSYLIKIRFETSLET